jgi:hypothetical protein
MRRRVKPAAEAGRRENGSHSIGGLIGLAFTKPDADHLAGLPAFLSADFDFEPMVANLPGAAPLYGHESQFLLVMMEAIHGDVVVIVEGGSHRHPEQSIMRARIPEGPFPNIFMPMLVPARQQCSDCRVGEINLGLRAAGE